ncbi:MAG TPA: hypothetical protein VJ806_04640 [Luteimonas sp.]|nr:hypothetical protein [Luteimonas sp.]
MKTLTGLMLLALSTSPAFAAEKFRECDVSAWRHVFTSDPQGKDAGGNRQALIYALRRGSPLRVGWGEADADGKWKVEEFADARFTNLMGGRDVVAQLDGAMIQTNYTDAAKAGLRDPAMSWHALASTDGRLEAIMVETATGKVARKLVQRTHFHWYAFAPDPGCDARPTVDSAPRGRMNELIFDSRKAEPAKKP